MRILSIIIISFSILISTGCSKGSQVNGRNFKTALKSVKMIRARLPKEKRIAYELSFWAARTAYRSNSEFLDLVDGKTPDELIQLGKEVFEKRKAEGFEEYQQYATWEQMITKYVKDQDAQGTKRKRDPKDKSNSVLYKL